MTPCSGKQMLPAPRERRIRWNAFGTRFRKKMYGLAYLTVLGRTVIQLSRQDLELHQKESSALAEASAFTVVSKR
jgi:hypothetical protein